MSYIIPTLSVFVSSLLLIICFTGIGLGLRRLFGVRALDVNACALAFWNGFGIVILFLILWNFLFPVNGAALLTVFAAGMVGIIAVGPELRRLLGTDRLPSRMTWVVMLLAGLWISNLGTGPFTSWDGGLYHLQAVQWASHYPVIPGIANLHGPLAFNNSSFLYAALLDSGPWRERAFHLANGTLMLVFVWQVIIAGARISRYRSTIDDRDIYQIVLLAPVINLAMNGRMSDFNTDLPVTLVMLVTGVALYMQLHVRASDAMERNYRLVTMAILLSTIVSLKISVGSFAVFAAPVAIFVWWKDREIQPEISLKPLLWTASLVLLFALTWTTRGVVMSGYPLFPLPVLSLPVDWKAPVEHAAAEVANIVFTELEFSWNIGKNWLRHLLWVSPFTVFLPFGISLFAGSILLIASRSPRYVQAVTRDPRVWLLLLPTGIAIVIWYIVAPSLRYATPLFWTLAALLVARVYLLFEERLNRYGKQLLAAAILVSLLPLVTVVARTARLRDSTYIDAFIELYFVGPGPDAGFYSVLQAPNIKPFVTTSGLVLNTPDKDTPDIPMAKCWNLPLPCTPNPSKNLELRVPGHIEHGFRISGEWEMQDWPYYWRGDFLEQWRQRRD